MEGRSLQSSEDLQTTLVEGQPSLDASSHTVSSCLKAAAVGERPGAEDVGRHSFPQEFSSHYCNMQGATSLKRRVGCRGKEDIMDWGMEVVFAP